MLKKVNRMNMDLSPYGFLEYKGDHYIGFAFQTSIGSVDIQIIDSGFSPQDMKPKILGVLKRLRDVDTKARLYLDNHASEDLKLSGGLLDPSLQFQSNDPDGTFVIFYSGSRKDDEMCYGVEFQQFEPFDLLIGD